MSRLCNNTIFHLLLISLIGIIIYSNTFHSPFVFDDDVYIKDNPSIQNLSNFLDVSDTRYITFLTFAINYSLGGYNTLGYHVFNLSVHILNAILVFWLVVLTLRIQDTGYRMPFSKVSVISASVSDQPNQLNLSTIKLFNYLPLFIALLFVAHPIQTQAVTYIFQRSASLATFFYLLSLVMYVKARLEVEAKAKVKKNLFSALTLTFYLLSLFSAVLAMKTKEISFTFPFIITLYEFSFFNSSPYSKLEASNLKRFFYLLPILLSLLIIPLSLIGLGLGISTEAELDKGLGKEQVWNLIADPKATLPRYEYLLTQFRVIVTYIRLLFFPVNQNLLYDYPVYKSFFEPQVFLSFLFLLSILGIGIYLFYRSRVTSAISPQQSAISYTLHASASGGRYALDCFRHFLVFYSSVS